MSDYVVKVDGSIVRLYHGSTEKVICSGAVRAEVKKDEIIVTFPSDKKKVYSVRGFFKRNE